MTHGNIILTIQKAEGLVALNPGGTSNPYITATIGAQSVTTLVQHKTVNPVYDATFTFQDCPLPAIVTLRVFNKIQYVDVEDPLGTATVTVFEPQAEPLVKSVQLSHGGNAALAQRAPNGCGAVTLRYTVTPVTVTEGAAAESKRVSTAASSNNNSITSAGGLPTSLTAMPIPVPAAVNIDGTSAVSIPVATTPKDSRAGTPHTSAIGSSAAAVGLVASNPNTTNPAATTPKLMPVEAPSAAIIGSGHLAPKTAHAASSLNGSQQLNSQLTPPSLSPARVPAVSTFMVPQVAPAPPQVTPMPVNAHSHNGYVSHAVPGAKVPSVQPSQPPAPLPLPMELYYANNSVNQPASTPLPAVQQPSSNTASMLPVAPNAVPAVRYASMQETMNASACSSLEAAQFQPSVSRSSLYTSAAQAPLLQAQSKLVVVPPHIHGTPTPPSLRTSQPGMPSHAATAAQNSFPMQALTSQEQPGATMVAVAPKSPPLSSSASTSRRTSRRMSPTTLAASTQQAQPPHSFALENAAATGVAAAPSPAVPTCRAVAPAPATAGLQAPGAAYPLPAHPARVSPTRRSPKNESSTAAADAGVDTAAQLYADAAYLFEVAASGADEEIFRRLRAADPYLTNGFSECVDYSGRTLLHIAAWNGQLRLVQILLAPEPASPMLDLRSLVAAKSGNTVLHAAACAGQLTVAQWLRYGHPTAGPLLLTAHNARGLTPAECATEAGFPEVARLLIPN